MAKKQIIRLTERDLHAIIKESLDNILYDNGYSYNQIRNMTGIYDDDYMNAAADAERTDELEGEIAKALGGIRHPKAIDFSDAAKILKDRFGFDYTGSEEEDEAHCFTDGEYILELYPKTFYINQGRMVLNNLHLRKKKY